MARKHTFTIYDKMDADGAFDSNPANIGARDAQGRMLYKGPQPFPQMLYEPSGAFKISVQAEAVVTPFGPKMVGEQRELIYKIVENEAEKAEALAAGWLEKMSDAMAKNPSRKTKAELEGTAQPGLVANPASAAEAALALANAKIAELEAKLADE